ncbi:MAG TPA: hypothetical protein VG935_03980 [Patescibacteria group bacterium]|nr:hypothetical protein [Patescibacteria group bacterium]
MPRLSTLPVPIQRLAAENLYTLSIDYHRKWTDITMCLLIPQISTADFPMTYELLKLYLPSIFRCTCYNDDHVPFAQEVTQTELGHLFEHILLEYLCMIKLENGLDQAEYEGRTDWNWIRDPRGTFHIVIQAKSEEIIVLQEALNRTMKLMNVILSTSSSLKTSMAFSKT